MTILEWRNTPTEGGCYSSAQKLQSRRTCTLLPTAEQLLYPEIAINIVEGIQHRREATKQQYDRDAKQLPPLASKRANRPSAASHTWRKVEESYCSEENWGEILLSEDTQWPDLQKK